MKYCLCSVLDNALHSSTAPLPPLVAHEGNSVDPYSYIPHSSGRLKHITPWNSLLFFSVTDMLLHTFFCNECGCQHQATPGLDHNCVRASAGRRTAWRQHVDKHGLQGARLPHSLQKTMFKEIGKIPEAAREGIVPLCEVDMWNPKESPESPHSGLMRQPTKEGIPEGERPSQGFNV